MIKQVPPDTKLFFENITILVEPVSDGVNKCYCVRYPVELQEEILTLNDCLKIAKKELDFKKYDVVEVFCESYLNGIVYRWGNYGDSWWIVGKMGGFA